MGPAQHLAAPSHARRLASKVPGGTFGASGPSTSLPAGFEPRRLLCGPARPTSKVPGGTFEVGGLTTASLAQSVERKALKLVVVG